MCMCVYGIGVFVAGVFCVHVCTWERWVGGWFRWVCGCMLWVYAHGIGGCILCTRVCAHVHVYVGISLGVACACLGVGGWVCIYKGSG